MKHIRKFNEDMDDDNDNERLLSDSGEIHDSLLYDYGLGSDLEAYKNMKYNLNVDMDELPEEAKSLFNEIDETVEQVAPELRKKILRLYTVLTDDTSLNEK